MNIKNAKWQNNAIKVQTVSDWVWNAVFSCVIYKCHLHVNDIQIIENKRMTKNIQINNWNAIIQTMKFMMKWMNENKKGV